MRNNSSVKVRLAALFFLPIIFLTAPLSAGSRKHPAQQSPPSGPSYVLALAAANHFLHAWQSADLENGTVLLSDGIRRSHNADKLEDFFSSGKERGFEIGRGNGHAGRYSFPVVLVTTRGSHVTRRSSEIILIETGKNDWVIDKLP
jgi:hypothetical protein